MSFSKNKILKIWPTVVYLKMQASTPLSQQPIGSALGDEILTYLWVIKKFLFKKERNKAQSEGIFTNGFENVVKQLLQPHTKPHFRYINLWGVAWYMPFVRIKILKENMSDLEALDYAMGTVFFIMANNTEAAAVRSKHREQTTTPVGGRTLKLQSQFIGHIIQGAWWRIGDENRYKIGAYILKRKPELAIYLKDYYADSLEHIIKLYPDVFNPSDEGSSLYQNGEGCIAMLEEIAASHTFGDFDKVSRLPVHTLFLYLKHQAIKVRAQMAAQNQK